MLNEIIVDEAQAVSPLIADGYIDLVFADPVYDDMAQYEWLSREAARLLKPDAACLVWSAVKHLPEVIRAMSTHLSFRWQFIWYQSNRRGHADFGYPLYTPLLWFEKGHSMPRFPVQDIRNAPFTAREGHRWQKEPGVVEYFVSAFTVAHECVFDPFCGGGAVPVACKRLERTYIAVEIDERIAKAASEAVMLAQPPIREIEYVQGEIV
jgi:DNA modification methylase